MVLYFIYRYLLDIRILRTSTYLQTQKIVSLLLIEAIIEP